MSEHPGGEKRSDSMVMTTSRSLVWMAELIITAQCMSALGDEKSYVPYNIHFNRGAESVILSIYNWKANRSDALRTYAHIFQHG